MRPSKMAGRDPYAHPAAARQLASVAGTIGRPTNGNVNNAAIDVYLFAPLRSYPPKSSIGTMIGTALLQRYTCTYKLLPSSRKKPLILRIELPLLELYRLDAAKSSWSHKKVGSPHERKENTMSVSSITGSNAAIPSTQLTGISSVNSSGQDSDGDNDGSRVSGASGGGGKFASAIGQALSQLGISPGAATSTTTSPSSTSSTTQDPQQALAAFMQNLFAALQSQSGQSGAAGSAAGAGADPTAAVAGTAGHGHHHHHGGGMGKIEGGLQNLIQQLSSSSSSSASDSTTSGSSSGTSNSTLDALQQSFNSLLSTGGTSGSNASLSSFLQSLSQSMQGAAATGNVVSQKV